MNTKRIIALALAAVLSLGLLSACGDKQATEVEYSVTVLDGQGQPCASGVIVKFMQGGAQAAMQTVDAQGVARKTLPAGEYSVELAFTGDRTDAHYDPVTLTAAAPAAKVTLVNKLSQETTPLFAQSPATGEMKEYNAHKVLEGSSYATIQAGERNYFLFTPTQAGTYRFSVDNKDLKLGYYGAPSFVQSQNLAEVAEGSFTVSISKSMVGTGESTGTNVLVIGIDGGEAETGCILSVVREGEPEYSYAEEPWTVYQKTVELSPYKLEEGASLTYIDIKGQTADNQVIYNEADGYYHFGTADGPVVLIHLDKNAPNVSLQVVIQGNGLAGGTAIRKYFFDENGEFVKKEEYTPLLEEYFVNMDQDAGVYPLTKDLVYILENGCSGWWDSTSPDFILEGCNPELGWMFALCYVR